MCSLAHWLTILPRLRETMLSAQSRPAKTRRSFLVSARNREAALLTFDRKLGRLPGAQRLLA